ncbi:Glycosyltransferase [Rhynchospora pubera]|uniref:Glycosyltransferase n=1 Tax=Rhynchospora pubera TaxID=906938 RepID=A0AAV8F8G2_9POAL|nr:Glycosyltransferase [Rhynchospora pubera]
MVSKMSVKDQHFLVVIFHGQGHINPGQSFAKRLAKATGAKVTFSTTVSNHRLMFPSLTSPDEEITDEPITYIPYSDGYDNGIKWFIDDPIEYHEKFNQVGRATFSSILDNLAARGRPVTCIVYSMQMHWVKELALERGIPTAFHWVQSARMLGLYYHYLRGYRDLINSHIDDPFFVVSLPHLPQMMIKDMPPFFMHSIDETFKTVFEILLLTIESSLKPGKDGSKPMILINTFEALELDALKCIEEADILPIGPDVRMLIPDGNNIDISRGYDLFKADEKAYMDWLDTKPENSVVYVSFGSIATMSKKQIEEIQCGLKESGRPYLLVLRKNNRETGVELEEGENSMVLEWCNQAQVLSHPSIGCFLTHCGWNSTLESLTCGVPMVAVQQWADQDTNARMVVECSAGVRGEVNKEGVLEAEMLRNCLEKVMGSGERGLEIRKCCKMWKEKAREATRDGGSSHCNFNYFLEKIVRLIGPN